LAQNWHPDFDGVAPVDLLEEGHIEAIEDFVLTIETGVPYSFRV
jgi:hypothetical protein